MKIFGSFLVGILISFSVLSFSEASSNSVEQSATVDPMKAKPRRRIASTGETPIFNPSPEILEKMNDPQEPFNAYYLRRSIGFEGGLPVTLSGSSTTSILSSPAVSYSVWNSPTSGWEFFFGTSKSADTVNASEVMTPTYAGTVVSATTTVTSYTGTANPRAYIVGLAYKHRLYQVKYFGLSLDFLATYIPKRSSEFNSTGSTTVTVADVVNAPTTYTVAESFTTRESSVSHTVGLGPRFNIEYNFPYVPNLLIGVTTGLFVNVGGETKTVDTVTNKTTAYTGGVAGTPTFNANHGKTTHSTTDPGVNGGSYAIGGTGLNLTGAGGLIPISVVGTFRIRYAF